MPAPFSSGCTACRHCAVAKDAFQSIDGIRTGIGLNVDVVVALVGFGMWLIKREKTACLGCVHGSMFNGNK